MTRTGVYRPSLLPCADKEYWRDSRFRNTRGQRCFP